MYELICEDSWGDGWEGGFLEIAGLEFCKDFRYNFPNDCGESYVHGCNTERRIQYITITGMITAKSFIFLSDHYILILNVSYLIFHIMAISNILACNDNKPCPDEESCVDGICHANKFGKE